MTPEEQDILGPESKPVDGRAAAARINGKKGGLPPGYPQDWDSHPSKGRTKEEDVIEAVASRVMAGGKVIVLPKFTKPPTEADKKRVATILGMSLEVFNQRMAERLAILSDKISKRIEEKIDEDKFKPSELGFIFSVTEDKRRALDARAQVGAAQVNIQVNNYGEKSREEIMEALKAPFNPSTHEL